MKRIRLGNTVFSFDSTMQMELGGNLPLFETGEDADIFVHIRYAEPREDTPHANGYAKIEKLNNGYSVAIPHGCFPKLTAWQILSMLPLSKILMQRGTMILHASYILHEGGGILFSGPSGIGKSTQAALWEKYCGSSVINGDRVLITPGTEEIMVGSHYLCGTSGICTNVTAPLEAIVLLDQAEKNEISIPSPLERFRQVMSQLDYDFRDAQQMIHITALVEKLMARARVIRYACKMDESAVICLKEYLSEG